jgi:hypothetical protein
MRHGLASDLTTRQVTEHYAVWIGRPRTWAGPNVNFSIDPDLPRFQRAALVNAYRQDVNRMRRDRRGEG